MLRFVDVFAPLLVALVGAVSACVVAIWNTRGESAAIKRIKAINELISELPPEAKSTHDLLSVRDRLVTRIAARLSRSRGVGGLIRLLSLLLALVGLVALFAGFAVGLVRDLSTAGNLFYVAAGLLGATPVFALLWAITSDVLDEIRRRRNTERE